jgi:hypothetical protein
MDRPKGMREEVWDAHSFTRGCASAGTLERANARARLHRHVHALSHSFTREQKKSCLFSLELHSNA